MIHELAARPLERVIEVESDFPRGRVVEPIWIAGGAKGSAPGVEFDEPTSSPSIEKVGCGGRATSTTFACRSSTATGSSCEPSAERGPGSGSS